MLTAKGEEGGRGEEEENVLYGQGGEEAEKRRKLARMEALRQTEQTNNPTAVSIMVRDRGYLLAWHGCF